MFLTLAASALAMAAVPASAPPRYAEGQVWEYRTRPGDEGSRLKIRKIAPMPGATDRRLVYHITIVGVDLGSQGLAGVISHVPVSKETLDVSVTRLSSSGADFGGVKGGMKAWRRAKGGVFTISVAEIVGLVADTAATGRSQAD